ncbi:MAG: M48 family metallopeptidase [Gammaproteobacteria bacterium]|nr:MAG: M48 family metallopeptidase [Gammaproteobacteria bacterium]
MQLSARYYDGRTSQACEVQLEFTPDGSLSLLGEGVSFRFAFSTLEIGERLGKTPRSIRLPNGGKCEVADNETLDRILAGLGAQQRGRWLHRLESSLAYVVVAVALTGGFAWGMVEYGIPWLAERAAYALPHSVDRQLGQGTLKVLDKSLFSATQLDEKKRTGLQRRFVEITRELEDGDSYRLEFRSSEKIGANAFALPSGIVVITDELVRLGNSDDEIASVLAHEVGHLEHRHSLRTVMQDSALALLIATVTGDPFSSSTLAVALPTVLVHAQYSREYEIEADDYAYRYLTNNGIPTQVFADMLQRLSGDQPTSAVEAFLSSHPGTVERIERFRTGSVPLTK